MRFVDRRIGPTPIPRAGCRRFRPRSTTGAPVADEALTWMQERRERFAAEEFFPGAGSAAALLAFLKPRAGLYARLSEMHDCGLLGRMFPEFQAIVCRVVRDFHHKYTVDEHTLLTVRNLERLATVPRTAASVSARCVAELAQPGTAGAVAALPRRRQMARRGPRRRERADGAGDDATPAAPAGVESRSSNSSIRHHTKMSLSRSGATPRIRRSSANSRTWSSTKSG